MMPSDDATIDGAVTSPRGLSRAVVEEMSRSRGEPNWLRDLRLTACSQLGEQLPVDWRVEMAAVTADAQASARPTWDMATVDPADRNHRRSGADEASERAHRRHRAELERQGVVYCSLDKAMREHGDLVASHLGRVCGPADGAAVALNTALWSGGSFIHVPQGVRVELPLLAHARAVGEMPAPFERTLIVADEGSAVHYMEGCSAPVYTASSLRAGVVEVVVGAGAHVTHTTVQNWTDNVVSTVSKRARVEAEGDMQWIDGSLGAGSMTSSTTALVGPGASGGVRSVTYAGAHRHQRVDAEMIHAAPHTSSSIMSRSISAEGGRTSHREVVRVFDDATGCRSNLQCEALLLDERSACHHAPELLAGPADSVIGFREVTARVAGERLFYLMSRGLAHDQAVRMIIEGFVQPVVASLPMEYGVEWSRLIGLQLENSIG